MYIYSECRPDLTDATLADFKDAAAWLVAHAEDRDRVSHMPGKDRVAKMLKEVSCYRVGTPAVLITLHVCQERIHLQKQLLLAMSR